MAGLFSRSQPEEVEYLEVLFISDRNGQVRGQAVLCSISWHVGEFLGCCGEDRDELEAKIIAVTSGGKNKSFQNHLTSKWTMFPRGVGNKVEKQDEWLRGY